MQQVRDGDTERLGELFERHHRLLFTFFHNRRQSPQQCQDLVQMVFYRILKYRHQYRGDGTFKNWMFHIARNVLYDQQRKNKRRRTETVDDWHDQVVDQSPTWMDEQLATERLDRLRQAIDQLPPDKKEILTMSKLESRPYKEIGRRLGCTEGAIKVKVFRAMKALKAIYQNTEP